MASYILRHEEYLRKLVPGRKTKNKRITDLEELIEQSKLIEGYGISRSN
jgi:hypothetical protein